MKVYGFPRAQHDECFSSWYFRCLQVSNEDAQLLDIPKYAIEPDFWLTGQESLRYTYGSVNARTLMIFFREQSSWVLPWEQRRAYCHHCFCDDIKAGLIPYWRKRWCYLHCPICAKHTCQLEEFSDFSIGIDKSWAAFAGYCKSAEKSTSRALISRPPQRIIFLALQVQLLLELAHKKNCLRLPGDCAVYHSEEIKTLCRFLFESFLYPRFRFADLDGLARGCQRHRHRLDPVMNYQQGALLGCSLCDIFPRISALILIGCVLGVFPEQQLIAIDRLLLISDSLLNINPFDIGRLGIRFDSLEHHKATMTYLENLSASLYKRIEPFVAGVARIYAVRG
ncbi:TPA: hypothetical protein ACXLB5_005114 [Pseudomonas aeruginosa]|uniref:hypothetical protein n=1 Tax=Pseudomonas tohonis TaxID=2725477 RepID=UPI001566BA7C|nr:hypothetical protein [Pseudomonas tohonis]